MLRYMKAETKEIENAMTTASAYLRTHDRDQGLQHINTVNINCSFVRFTSI